MSGCDQTTITADGVTRLRSRLPQLTVCAWGCSDAVQAAAIAILEPAPDAEAQSSSAAASQ